MNIIQNQGTKWTVIFDMYSENYTDGLFPPPVGEEVAKMKMY